MPSRMDRKGIALRNGQKGHSAASMRTKRGCTLPSRSTVSHHMAAGRTQRPRSPYKARYTTIYSSVSLCRAMPSTSYSLPLKCR